ncbi:MAG: glycosyltransferase [Vicingaceae bacterium]|nr:glycosyltransferase [Vicingaceae bacterium]
MKNRILIFIDWYKPGFKAGGPIRSISNLVSQLNINYEFYIITRDTDYLETNSYTNIKTNEWNDIDNAKVFYLSSKNQNKTTIKKLIEKVKPNLIYCNSLYSPKFTITPIRIAKKLNIKTVLAVRGMLSSGSLSVKSHKKKIFLALVKGTNLFRKTTFHATSIDEATDIEKAFGKNIKTIIAQNLPENKTIPFKPKSKKNNELKMVFVGRIAPEKNILFAIQVLANCTQKIELDIFGPIYSQEYFDTCQEAINQLPDNIVVNYKGVLNHELLDETLNNYHVLYLPSTGENYGHIILEGMCNSCIPVISDKTPWQNLTQQKIGFDIDIMQPNKFSEKIDHLAKMDEIPLNKMSKNAYGFAQTIINDIKLKEEYHKLFNPKD